MFGRGIFFWRALTQWLGGVGVIALFIAVLPRLAIGGRELFFAEAAGPTDEKLTPQLRQTAIALWKLYGALTAVAGRRRSMLAGMSLYDAVCHAFATMAAGGFSPHPQSIAGYQSAGDRLDHHRVHVRRRRQLRAAVPRGARQPQRAGPGRGVPRLRRHRDRRDGHPGRSLCCRQGMGATTRSGTARSRWSRSSRPPASRATTSSSGAIRRRWCCSC